MARHGESKHFKRSVVTDLLVIPRKKYKYYVRQYPGKHNRKYSMSLLAFLRDVAKIAKNAKEARYLIKGGFVKVDGKQVKEETDSVGFNDIIQVKDDYFTISFSKKGTLDASRSEKEVLSKSLKVVSKMFVKGGKAVLGLSDGTNVTDPDNKAQIGDSVILQLKDRKIEKVIPFEQGREVLIFIGKNAGKKGKVLEIEGDTAIVETEDGKISVKAGSCISV